MFPVDRSLGFGNGGELGVSDTQLLAQLVRLLSANPNYYPWSLIPPDGKAFDVVNTIGTPTVAAGETEVTRLRCPDGYDGIVQGLSNNVFGPSFDPGLPSLIWRIRNGVSINASQFVDGYNRIIVEFGSTNFTRDTAGIFVSSGQTLLYTIENEDAGYPVSPATQITCAFRGFFWPAQRGK